jgi:hypothetical protein
MTSWCVPAVRTTAPRIQSGSDVAWAVVCLQCWSSCSRGCWFSENWSGRRRSTISCVLSWASLNFLLAFRDRLWSPSSLLPSGHQGPFPWIKRQGLEADYSPPSSGEVKTMMELYLHFTIRLHSVELKYLSTGTAFPLPWLSLYKNVCSFGNNSWTPPGYIL